MNVEELRKILRANGWVAAPLVEEAGAIATVWIPPGGSLGQAVPEEDWLDDFWCREPEELVAV